MTVALGIHGVGNLRPGSTAAQASAALGTAWAAFLSTRLTSPLPEGEVPVAYYADLLDANERQGAGEDPDQFDPATAKAILAWARQYNIAPEEDAQGRATAPLRWIVDRIASKLDLDQGSARSFVARFFPEVLTYLHNGDTKGKVETVVAKAIGRYRPRVVLAHSLGSVIAYETLWAHRELTVDVLVTLGSPLAMPNVVFEHLYRDCSNSRGRPPGVRTWINFADPGDPVAVPPRLSDQFSGLAVDSTATIGAFAFHSAKGYLSHPATATAVAPYLTLPS
ncbi:serine peptidase [Streptomyces sp. V1I6]|uniref:serine peptidase n=1 Tax=Streptomyces sp. V1I6 TaxID=3042273 RepID=UPI00278545B0|nr:serine peptidase [Streptomyces sp. V1I6]MDQ0847411.1 hypothetical protein [Streptomyces sp. V1I6]